MYDPDEKTPQEDATEPAAEETPIESVDSADAPGPGEEEAAPAADVPAEEGTAEEATAEAGEEAEVVELLEPEPEPTAEELLQARLEETASRLRAVSKAYKDGQAEMQAFRERMENQAKFKAERQAFEQARTFFEPVQNLKRSVDNADQDKDALVSGLQMVLSQFMNALEKLGMESIPGIGSTFDPRIHEALAITPVAEADQDGKVLMVHADGYTVNGKVLQAAQVIVGKYEEPAGEA